MILSQFSETDALFQIARGSIRTEKTTQLGDGTVVISRLGPPSVFGEFCFLMGARTASLTSFIADEEGTELYIIKPESLQPYVQTKPMMPVCLYKYLAGSMAGKYRVLSATAGFGLARTGGHHETDMEEVTRNPVFVSIYSRYLSREKPELLGWLQFWQEVQEFRTMPRGMAANKQARLMHAQFVQPGRKGSVPLPAETVAACAAAVNPPPHADGTTALVRPELFDEAAAETFEQLRAHTFTKFVASKYYAGVQELKAREKEVPTVHHFYYMKKLGTGSFGEVFKVRKKDSHTVYAMKVMSKRAQAQMSKRCAHAHLAPTLAPAPFRPSPNPMLTQPQPEHQVGHVPAYRDRCDGAAQPPLPGQPELLVPDAARRLHGARPRVRRRPRALPAPLQGGAAHRGDAPLGYLHR